MSLFGDSNPGPIHLVTMAGFIGLPPPTETIDEFIKAIDNYLNGEL